MLKHRTRVDIIRAIKAKARLATALHFKHDPEPSTPDLCQTVGIKDISFLVHLP